MSFPQSPFSLSVLLLKVKVAFFFLFLIYQLISTSAYIPNGILRNLPIHTYVPISLPTMTSRVLGAFIDVALSVTNNGPGHTIPSAPQKSVPRLYHSLHSNPDPVGLDLRCGVKPTGTNGSGTTSPGYQTPRVPIDLEMSRPTTPSNEQAGIDTIQSFSNPPMNRFRMLSICLMNFGNGLNDSAPGALIPYIEKYSCHSCSITILLTTIQSL